MTKTLDTLRSDAMAILWACLDAADPEQAVKNAIQIQGDMLRVNWDFELNLQDIDRIFVVGGGKASAPMGKAIEEVFGDRINGGLICVKYGHGLNLTKTEVVEGSHPLPDRAGEEATGRIIEILESLGERDLVISCISGGGSALMPSVPAGLTLEEKQDLTGYLLAIGADIHEINAVRKHLSTSKGGNLARYAFPAHVLNLMLSDVVGDDPDTIASGPFVPDRSTYTQVVHILDKYDLWNKVPDSIATRVREGAEGHIAETPKVGDAIFERVRNVIVGCNYLSLSIGEEKARDLGYETLLLSSCIEGDTSQAALFHSAIAREVRSTGSPVRPPACILSGGETTVVIQGDGKGGRNQHFALSLVRRASRIPDCVFLSAGTDGTDGPTDAAGAFACSDTFSRAESLGMNPEEFLRNSDSYTFFERLGDLVITGPTRTNVMDLRVCLIA
jgi:glycerate 2-kinase